MDYQLDRCYIFLSLLAVILFSSMARSLLSIHDSTKDIFDKEILLFNVIILISIALVSFSAAALLSVRDCQR